MERQDVLGLNIGIYISDLYISFPFVKLCYMGVELP